jgi:hypothetical protein
VHPGLAPTGTAVPGELNQGVAKQHFQCLPS